MKRKIICLTLVAIFVLVFSMNVFATNNNTIPVEEDNDVLNEVFANYRLIDKESLVKDIIEMNKKYPEARLSVEEALEEYEKIAGLSVAEQIEYFKEINTGVPVSRFVRESKDGSYSVLSVRNSLAYFEVGRTLGTSSYSNGITTYQGTQVWAHNIYYMPGANASYYVNHFFNYPASYGRVTSLYSVSGSGGYPIAVGGGEIVSSSGEIAAVKYLMIDMSGGYNIGYAYEKLSFNATTKTASLTTLPLY
ncbi:MAG: hypothetical protein IK082_04765 [Oscillospiraceae bacterium]|nr:hypothetical protein [Oscillospiraceae bacterium]